MQRGVVQPVYDVSKHDKHDAIEECALPRLEHIQRGAEVVPVDPGHVEFESNAQWFLSAICRVVREERGLKGT